MKLICLVMFVNGITRREHDMLHGRLRRRYGRANKCENKGCTYKTPKSFQWSLLKGHTYSDNPKDYIQLCTSCHRKYDFNDEIREKLKAKKVGQLHNKSKLKNADVINIISLLNSGFSNKNIAKKYSVDPSTISDIKRGKRWGEITGIKYKTS